MSDEIDNNVNNNESEVEFHEEETPTNTVENIFDNKNNDNMKKDTTKTSDGNKITAACFEWLQAVMSAMIVVIILFTFVFRIVNVNGESMQNTLFTNDKVIVTSLFYKPQNGDIVVISHGAVYNKPLIKRVIATEGQKLKIDFETGSVYVNDALVDEPYIKGFTKMNDINMKIPEVIPEGYVFVMGDNRSNSKDSRNTDVGLIKVDDILGKAQFVVFPFNRMGSLY